jgi:hypothetical protein
VAGVPVTFSAAPSGTTSLSETTGTTDQNGEVSLEVTPDASGVTSITVIVAGCGGTAKLNVSAAAPYQITSVQVAPSFVQVNPAQSDWPVVSGQVLDQYGNPVTGADITVSGGYGPHATGATNANGVFNVDVDPTNVGGPYYLTVLADDSLGSVSATSGTGLTVVQYPPATMEISLVNPGQSIYTGQLIPVYCTLYNQNMQLWSDATVKFVTVTDQTALSNLTPSGPAGSGTGSLQQDTGTYGNGEAAANVNFDQSGSQTVLAELYINGNFTGACAALTVTVLPGAVAQIVWNPVQPGTTVTAGTTLTVSGVALNSLGNPVPAGTEVTVQMPGTSVQPQTVYTSDGTGYFATRLTVTSAGSWPVQAVASGQAFQYGTLIVINPGPVARGDLWFGGGYSSTQTIAVGGSIGVCYTLTDQYYNVIPNVTPTYTVSDTGAPPVNQPAPSDKFGNGGTNEGPFYTAGTFTFYLWYDGRPVPLVPGGSQQASIQLIVSPSAQQYGGLSGTTGSFTPTTITANGQHYQWGNSVTVTAGSVVTISGYALDTNRNPMANVLVWNGSGGSSPEGESAYTTGSNGYFSFSYHLDSAGNGVSQQIWVVAGPNGVTSTEQQFNVIPGPTQNLQVTIDPPVSGDQDSPIGQGGVLQSVLIAATDGYGNPVNVSAQITTSTQDPSVVTGLPFSTQIQNGAALAVVNARFYKAGTWPITVTTADGAAKTANFTVQW